MKYDRRMFEPPLDHGIERAVLVLREAGIETYAACQGGEGHSYLEPTVRFHGGPGTGYKALGIAMIFGLPVKKVQRFWTVIENEPTGPSWEMTFSNHVHLSKKEMAFGTEFNDPFRPELEDEFSNPQNL